MFYFIQDMEITNINKVKYKDLIEILKKDRTTIEKVILPLKKVDHLILGCGYKIIEKTIQSNTKGVEYRVRVMQTNEGAITTLYSIFTDYLVIWPVTYLYGYTEEPYIILIKLHAIDRYAERYLKIEDKNESLNRFIDIFCLYRDPYLFRKSETDKVESLMCRIKDGVLLGYIYHVSPKILRLNTFISDVELDEANRDDQLKVRKNSDAWRRVQ